MHRTDLTVSVAAFDGYPFEIAVEALASVGVIHIEPALIQGYTDPFDEDIFSDRLARSMRREAETAGLTCVAFSAHVDVGAPGGDDQLRRRIRFAAELGANRVVTNAAKTEFRDAFLSRLDGLVREAEQAGVIIALENPGDGRPNIIDNAAAATSFIGRHGSPWLGLNYDPGNLLTHQPGLDPLEDALNLGPGLVSMHLKNAALNGERWRFTALNRGAIDYEKVLRHTDGLSRPPAYSVELPLRVSRAPGGTPFRDPEALPLEDIRNAIEESLAWLERR